MPPICPLLDLLPLAMRVPLSTLQSRQDSIFSCPSPESSPTYAWVPPSLAQGTCWSIPTSVHYGTEAQWVPRCLWEQQLLFRDGTSCPSKCHALNTMPHTESLPMGHTCWAAGRGKKAQVWAGLPWTLTLARASDGRNCSSPVLCEPPTFLSPV